MTREYKRLICIICHEDRDLADLTVYRSRSNFYTRHRSCLVRQAKSLGKARREALVRYGSKPENEVKRRARSLARSLDPQQCEVCGARPEDAKIHKHHDDYSKPLEVRFLCTPHHGELHRQINLQRATS